MQDFTAPHTLTRLLLALFLVPVQFPVCAKGQSQPLLSSEQGTPLFIKDGVFWLCHVTGLWQCL